MLTNGTNNIQRKVSMDNRLISVGIISLIVFARFVVIITSKSGFVNATE
jgi:hypothetical protein